MRLFPSLLAIAASLAAAGCAADADSHADVESSTEDLTKESVVLTSGGTDPVQFTVEVVDEDADANTKYWRRGTTVIVARGTTYARFRCALQGTTSAVELACGVRSSTLSTKDFPEAIRFSLIESGGSYRLENGSYEGEPNYLIDEATAVLGVGVRTQTAPLTLTVATGASASLERNPFALGDSIGAAIAPLVGRSIRAGGAARTIQSIDQFRVDETMQLQITVATSAAGPKWSNTNWITLWTMPYDRFSGLAPGAKWLERLGYEIPTP